MEKYKYNSEIVLTSFLNRVPVLINGRSYCLDDNDCLCIEGIKIKAIDNTTEKVLIKVFDFEFNDFITLCKSMTEEEINNCIENLNQKCIAI